MEKFYKSFIVEKYNYGGGSWKNVAIFFKRNFWSAFMYPKNLEIIARYNKINLFILDTEQENLLDKRSYDMDPNEFENFYIKHHDKIKELYKTLKVFITDNKINLVLFCANLIPFKLEFLDEIKKHTKIASRVQDDDVFKKAEKISKPYVKYYDYAFCSSVYYKWDEILMKDMYKKRGAKNSEFIPLWLYHHKYDENRNIDYENRDIDLLYVWWLYLSKILRVFKLKKHFKDRMRIYGRWWISPKKWKNKLFSLLRWYYNVEEIKPLNTQEEFIEIYQRTKIWFNLHQEYGPTNARMYELPWNWVMQICDNEKWLSHIFELDKEVVWYKTLNEAIQKIEYYLKHDEERIRIAKAGNKRVQEYRIEKCFEKILSTVFKD